MKLKRVMAALTFVAAGVAAANAVATGVDPTIPAYTKTTGVSGNLSSVGSDTLANLMTLWPGGVRAQRQPDPAPDHGTSGRDFLVDSSVRR